jgi:hypothetical protein
MERRPFIRKSIVGTIGFSGCVTQGTSDDEVLRRIDLRTIKRGTDGFPVTVSFELDSSNITTADTGRVRIKIRNETSRQLKIGTGSEPVFADRLSEPHGWVLYRTDVKLNKTSNRCWERAPPKVDGENSNVSRVVDSAHLDLNFIRYMTLQPQEVRSVIFELWSDYAVQKEGCMPTGKFNFDNTYTLYKEELKEFTAGFSLEVKKT